MPRLVTNVELDLLLDLLHEHIDGIKSGTITGSPFCMDEDDVDDLQNLHAALTDARDRASRTGGIEI